MSTKNKSADEGKLFAIAGTPVGELNALVKNIMRQTGVPDANEAVRLVNSGEWIVSKPMCCWREQDGVIYMTVTSNGRTGPQWIKYLKGKGIVIGDYAKSVLHSKDFKPTRGVTYEIAILKSGLFAEKDCISCKIRFGAEGGIFTKSRKLHTPNAEIACLIREVVSDKMLEDMCLWRIVAMHEPIKDCNDNLRLISVVGTGVSRGLSAVPGNPDSKWNYREDGFAFVF